MIKCDSNGADGDFPESLASLDNAYTVGSAQHRAEPDRNTALVKEGEFESPEKIAAIEKNREDRERTVVIDRQVAQGGLVSEPQGASPRHGPRSEPQTGRRGAAANWHHDQN